MKGSSSVFARDMLVTSHANAMTIFEWLLYF